MTDDFEQLRQQAVAELWRDLTQGKPPEEVAFLSLLVSIESQITRCRLLYGDGNPDYRACVEAITGVCVSNAPTPTSPPDRRAGSPPPSPAPTRR